MYHHLHSQERGLLTIRTCCREMLISKQHLGLIFQMLPKIVWGGCWLVILPDDPQQRKSFRYTPRASWSNLQCLDAHYDTFSMNEVWSHADICVRINFLQMKVRHAILTNPSRSSNCSPDNHLTAYHKMTPFQIIRSQDLWIIHKFRSLGLTRVVSRFTTEAKACRYAKSWLDLLQSMLSCLESSVVPISQIKGQEASVPSLILFLECYRFNHQHL